MLRFDAASASGAGVPADDEEPTLPIGPRPPAVRRHPLARGTAPPPGREEPAGADEISELCEALVEARCTAQAAVMRVVRWEIEELEAFARDTAAAPGALFQPGLVRGVLGLTEGRLTGLAIDAVGAVVSERLVGAGARSIRRMARAFAGTDALVDEALGELAAAARQARHGITRRRARELHAWALAERHHAAAIEPAPGKLASALLAMWVVKSCDRPSRPRAGVDEVHWHAACRRLFGVGVVPPSMMARLQLEAMWIDMGLAVNGQVRWPEGGAGVGTALFSYAANPRALAASLEGHSRTGARYRHLAAGGRFQLRFRFTVRPPALAEVEYDLELLAG
jgi:hypothetical protein